MAFEILSEITQIVAIASGHRIRQIRRLRKLYGAWEWRKLKGIATVRLANGKIREAELHWYAAHGVGKKELKIKRLLD